VAASNLPLFLIVLIVYSPIVVFIRLARLQQHTENQPLPPMESVFVAMTWNTEKASVIRYKEGRLGSLTV
jgi:hypothetical protein